MSREVSTKIQGFQLNTFTAPTVHRHVDSESDLPTESATAIFCADYEQVRAAYRSRPVICEITRGRRSTANFTPPRACPTRLPPRQSKCRSPPQVTVRHPGPPTYSQPIGATLCRERAKVGTKAPCRRTNCSDLNPAKEKDGFTLLNARKGMA